MSRRRSLAVLAALLLPLLFLGVETLMHVWQNKYAPSYTVAISGYDPRDLVYGKFIQFRYLWDDPKSDKPPQKDLPATGRFYVPENTAYNLQAMLTEGKHQFAVTISLSGKNAHIKTMTIDGAPWAKALGAWEMSHTPEEIPADPCPADGCG